MNPIRFAPALLLALAPSVTAQEPDSLMPPPEMVIVQPTTIQPGAVNPHVPQPPVPLQNRESNHPHPTLPVGPESNRPQPSSPESFPADPAIQPAGTGAFRFFQNELCNTAGGSRSPRTPEPANGVLRDTVFQTGNWHAAISPDNGQTWNDVSPYSFFPAADGGFCCDQQAADIASHGFVVWMLQYSNVTGGPNRLRFAVANTRDKLRSGSASDWYYYDIRPSTFGYSADEWFDYEDIAWDGTNFYCRTNVIGASVGSESIIMRWPLTEMGTAQSIPISYYRGSNIGGWSHRLAKGCVGTMAFAALNSTTQIYVWTWPSTSGSSATRSTRTIAAFTDAAVSVPGPDGRDWAGFWNATGQIQGAYGNATECGFSWGCAPRSGRAMPYTRIARFLLSDRSLVAEHDIWSGTNAYLYNDMMSNAAGDVGGTLAWGSSTSYVTTANYIIDSYDPWPPSTVYYPALGSSGPNTNRFGDYFTVRRHPISTNTWFSNGSSCPDPNTGNHRYVWFGRDDYEPTWVNVNVNSTPTGASITQDVESLDGLAGGTANYVRRFAPRQGYELTAPASRTVGLSSYVFKNWRLQVQPGAAFTEYSVGDRVLTVADCGNLDDVAEAVYVLRRTLTVQSVNPASGVSITVSPDDVNGAGNGTTQFTRQYRDDEVVSLTAPSAVGANPFRHWTIGGVAQGAGVTTVLVTMSAARTAVAVYWNHVVGSVASIGAGCVGGNGLVPNHTITQTGSEFVQGTTMTYRVTNAATSQIGVLHFGLSTTSWGSFALPLNLNFIGMTGCSLYHDIVVSENIATNFLGTATFNFNWPVNPATVGAQIFTTFAIIDPTVRRPLTLTHSNAMRLTLGGNN